MMCKSLLIHFPGISIARILFVLLVMIAVPDREGRAVVPFMDGGVFVHLQGAMAYDSNVFANSNEQDDLFLTLIPEVQYLREAGVLHMDLRAGLEFIRFLDLPGQDAENPFVSIGLSYPHRPGRNLGRLTFDAGWRQRSSTREDIGARTSSDIFDVALGGRKHFSDRLGVRGLASYMHEEFRQGAYSEIDIMVLSADVVHVYSENLETFIGYRYRNSQTSGIRRRSLDIDDHLLQIGAQGQLAARTVGLVSGGLQYRVFNDAELSDVTRPYGMVSVVWTPRTRSEFVVSAIKDFSVTPEDRSIDSNEIRLVLNQGVYRGFSLEPRVSYVFRQVDRSEGTREDHRYEAGIGFIYELASGASTALRYSYRNQSSNEPFYDYTRHIIDLSARISF